jgi:hypothetical protein
MSKRRLGLDEFIRQEIEPERLEELASIKFGSLNPFARSSDDLEGDGPLGRPSDLPFEDPVAACAALRQADLRRAIWQQLCELVISGTWSCEARRADQIEATKLSGEVLRRAQPDFDTLTISLLANDFEDLTFLREKPEPIADQVAKLVAQFCSANDPQIHRAKDVAAFVRDQLGYDVTDSFIKEAIKKCGVDPAWSLPGRRSISAAKKNP